MIKFCTVAMFLFVLGAQCAENPLLASSKELVRMDLWIFGLEDSNVISSSSAKSTPEELRVALQKLEN